MKRLILIVIILLTTISTSFGAYVYNESYTDLYLDSNGWCANLEITFQVFNITDFENKKTIEDDLCEPGCVEDCNWDDDEDCIECEWECAKFNYIEEATVKIYDGPMDSLPVLIETKTNATGQFKYTFPTAQRHLIEIFPDEDNYNDFHHIYDLYSCGHAQDITIKTNKTPKDIELEYPIQGIKLSVKQTTMNKAESFIINETIKMPKPLENTIRYFELTATTSEFETIEMHVTLEDTNTINTTSLKWYNPNTRSWEEKKSTIQKDEIIFDTTSLGIYAITQKTQEVEPEPIIEEQNQVEEEEQQNQQEEPQQKEKEAKTLINENTTTPKTNKNLIIGIIIGATLLLIIIIFAIKSKSKRKHYHENNPSTPQEPHKHILTTYEATYQQAKKYVQQHKEKYGKDSLYRALEKANVPKDIIDKVFIEEY